MKNRHYLWNRFFMLFIGLVVAWIFPGCENRDPEVRPIPYDKVNGFVTSEMGEKLLATSHGLYFLNESNGLIEPVENYTPIPPLYDLTYAKNTRSQDLWLASHAGALDFTSQIYLNEANSGLHSDELSNIHFDRDNVIYFATPLGISILNQQNWILNSGKDKFYLKYEISDIGSTTNGFTYVTTQGGGIERFKIEIDGISGATIFNKEWSGLESNNIFTVFTDDTIQAYGTDRGAALHFSEYTKRDWMVYTTKDGLINDTVLAIVKDLGNNWWFGTTGGISRLSESQWTSYSVKTHSIISNHVRFLAVDPDGTVWMATDQGLSKFSNDRWVSIPK